MFTTTNTKLGFSYTLDIPLNDTENPSCRAAKRSCAEGTVNTKETPIHTGILTPLKRNKTPGQITANQSIMLSHTQLPLFSPNEGAIECLC